MKKDSFAFSAAFRCALFIFTGLAAVYALTYSGAFTTDDEHLFVGGAESLARLGDYEAKQAYGNSRTRGNIQDVEPGQAVVGSFFVRWADANGLGATQSLFLLNIFVTALTACVVFWIVRVLCFQTETAALTAISYGVATMAWPYAQTYFRDPLAALMLAGAYLCFELALLGQTFGVSETPKVLRTVNRIEKRFGAVFWWALTIVFLAAGVFVKSTVAVAIPILFLAALIRSWKDPASVDRESVVTAGALVVCRKTRLKSRLRDHFVIHWVSLKSISPLLAAGAALALAALVLARLSPPDSALRRFSWDYLSFLFDFFLRAPRHAFWEAMLGPLVSPGKSLFLYSPILILAIPSTLIAWKTRWRQFIAPWLILLALIFAQALFYDDEWAGRVNWGLRFLLPAVPLLAVLCAPALELILDTRSNRVRVVNWILIAVSALAQIGGLAVSARAVYTAPGAEAASALALWDARYSPIVGHWRMLFSGAAWNFAWARTAAGSAIPVALVNVGWVVLLGGSIWGLMMFSRSRNRRSDFSRSLPKATEVATTGVFRAVLIIALALCFFLPAQMLKAYARDPAHYGGVTAFREATAFVDGCARSGDVILIADYGAPLWHYFLNDSHARLDWYSLPIHFPSRSELAVAANDPARALDPAAVALFNGLPSAYRRAWLINDTGELPGNFQLEEKWLANWRAAIGEWEFAQVRVVLFSLSGAGGPVETCLN